MDTEKLEELVGDVQRAIAVYREAEDELETAKQLLVDTASAIADDGEPPMNPWREK